MHSTIFELQPVAIRKESWATENNFTYNRNIDYCMILEGERRRERIELLYSCEWFNLLFDAGQNETIIYRGKSALKRFKKQWYRQMQKALIDIIYKGSSDTWRLEYAAKKPFEVETMFCIPAWTGDDAVYTQELITYLETLEDNTTLYICSVFDYHF